MIATKEFQKTRVLKKVVREGVKHKLKSMVEEKEDFEVVVVCNHPKRVKMNISCLKEQEESLIHHFSHMQSKIM